MISLFCFSGSALIVWLLCFPVRKELLRRQLIDRPNERSNHIVPTPRGGGVAILIPILTGAVLIALSQAKIIPCFLGVGAFLIGVVSLADDVKALPARIRFAVHSVGALLILGGVVSARTFPSSVSPPFEALILGILFLWIVGYTNAFNFMDGINGISAGQTLIVGIGMALIVGFITGNWAHPLLLCSLIMSGAALGFIPHNFPRARMFMGDVGSAPIGFFQASLAVAIASELGWYLVIPLCLLFVNYVLDTSITLFRRLFRGDRLYEAHKEHFYQRLVRSGRSHVFVTGWEMALQCVTLAVVLIYIRTSDAVSRGALILVVIAAWSLFFAYAEFLFSKTAVDRATGTVNI